MREALKRLTGDSLIYGLGQASGRAVQVLLVPVLTLVLAPDVFAIADLVQAYSMFAIMVLVLGLDGALVRFFYGEPDRVSRVRMVSTSLGFRLTTSLVVSALLAALSTPIAAHLFGSLSYRKYVLIGAATIPFTMLVMFQNDVLRVTFQPWKFIGLNLLQTVTTAGLTFWSVVVERHGVIGVLYGKLAGDAVTAMLGFVFIRASLVPRFDRAILRRMLAYGIPLVPATVAYGFMSAGDRYFLQRVRSLEEVGVYAVAVKGYTLVMMGVTAFSLAFFPFAHARAADPESPRLYARVLALYVITASAIALAAALFAPEALAILVQPAYRGAADPARLLVFAAVAYGGYYLACLGIQLSLRTSLVSWTTAGAAVTALVANALLVAPFGMMGAASATLAGNLVLAMSTYLVAQSVHPLPYRGRRLLALFTLALALGVLTPRFAPPGVAGWLVRLGALALFAVAGAAFQVWRERGSVTAAARARG